MIHAMAQNIWYEDRMWHYDELLRMLNFGTHFAVLPDGQAIRHNQPRTLLWHAAGANTTSCGVELLVPGVFNLPDLDKKIDGPSNFKYPHEQMEGLMNIMRFLVANKYVKEPVYDWNLHSVQSKGRKFDPGYAFSTIEWTEMLQKRYWNGK